MTDWVGLDGIALSLTPSLAAVHALVALCALLTVAALVGWAVLTALAAVLACAYGYVKRARVAARESCR